MNTLQDNSDQDQGLEHEIVAKARFSDEETLVQYYMLSTNSQIADQKLLQDFFQNKPRRSQVLQVLHRWLEQNFSDKIDDLLKKCESQLPFLFPKSEINQKADRSRAAAGADKL